MDMKKAWAMAKEKAAQEGGSSKDYLGEMMRLTMQEMQSAKAGAKEVVVPDTVTLRLDALHKELITALLKRGDYKNTSDFFRQAVRYMAARELTDEELVEIVMSSVFE